MKQIKIHIGADGETTISTTGFKGKQCQEVTKELEKALGKATSEKLTGEYYETPVTNGLSVNGGL